MLSPGSSTSGTVGEESPTQSLHWKQKYHHILETMMLASVSSDLGHSEAHPLQLPNWYFYSRL